MDVVDFVQARDWINAAKEDMRAHQVLKDQVSEYREELPEIETLQSAAGLLGRDQ